MNHLLGAGRGALVLELTRPSSCKGPPHTSCCGRLAAARSFPPPLRCGERCFLKRKAPDPPGQARRAASRRARPRAEPRSRRIVAPDSHRRNLHAAPGQKTASGSPSWPKPPSGPAASTDPAPDRASHNETQAAVFDENVVYFKDGTNISPEVQARLERIAASVPGLGENSRVLDVGAGTGPVSQLLHAAGVRDILAVDLSSKMLGELEAADWHGSASCLGNSLAVRTWVGDVVDLPVYLGPFDAVFINACFGNFFDPYETLLSISMNMRPGSQVVISHPEGAAFVAGLHDEHPATVPHTLPDRAGLEAMIKSLPLEIEEFVDKEQLYLARLRVPDFFAVAGAPLLWEGKVEEGFGRGSKQMGVPTANLPPGGIPNLADFPRGVYFGWARLVGGDGADGAVHKMVLNIGQRPTFADGEGDTVEVHILHGYERDFYGKEVRVAVCGFIRPEMRFNGLDALVARIRTDIGLASSQLDKPELQAAREDPFLTS